MDQTALRQLAEQLLAELDAHIADPTERAKVARTLRDALAAPADQGELLLLDALDQHPATREWMSHHGAAPGEDTDRGVALAGMPTRRRLGLYYVCPKGDKDTVLHTAPKAPPLCPTHGIAMRRVPG